MGLDQITTVIVNYRTLFFLKECVESFRVHYPTVKIILVDNGSKDQSTEYIKDLSEKFTQITSILNRINQYHGPGLDQGIRASHTNYVLTLDSDTYIKKDGFLEKMLDNYNNNQTYAVGELVYMDWFGYDIPNHRRFKLPYIRPYSMLLDRRKYLTLKPFIHHGSPAIRNMRHAVRSGYRLVDFPINQYIHHMGRGTCSQFGYGLGLRHTLENILHNFVEFLLA